MAPTLETPPAQYRERLGYCAAVLGLLVRGLDGHTRVLYRRSAPALLLLHRERRVLVLGLSGRLTLDNQGDFSAPVLALLNNALSAIGRSEILYPAGPARGWAVRYGPHQGPGPLGLSARGRVTFLAQWPPLAR